MNSDNQINQTGTPPQLPTGRKRRNIEADARAHNCSVAWITTRTLYQSGRVEYRLEARFVPLPTVPKSQLARCGAKCRSGEPCRAHVVRGRKRCKNHGGLSTGPRSQAGRDAIAASNRRRAAKT